MAQSYTTSSGVTVKLPGAYPSINVAAANAGLSTTGVLMLVGEAATGPRFSEEVDLDLESNAFGPDQLANVVAKYKEGPLVDAFRAACQPANDAQIPGSFSRAILAKTNLSTKGSGILTNEASTTYGTLYDKSYGSLGNLIYFQVVASVNETIPTTGAFTYIPAVGTVAYSIRANGKASVGGTLTAAMIPTTFVSTVNGLTDVACTGGADKASITATTATITISGQSGNTLTVTKSTAWAGTAPVAGDTVYIPQDSGFEGPVGQNVGYYVVTTVGSATMDITKLSDAGKVAEPGHVGGAVPAPVIGVITTPTNVSITAVGASPPIVYGAVTITLEAAAPSDGMGKSLEIAQLTTGTDTLTRACFGLGTAVASTWISKTGASYLLTSAAEYKANLKVNRQYDSVSEELVSGGEIAMKIGYMGTTCTATIDDTNFYTTAVGGSGGSIPSVALTAFPTISDLATYINSKPGYTCSVGSGVLGNLPTTALDDGVYNVATEFGAMTGRIKVDAYKFFLKASESSLVQLGNPTAQAASGLPKVMSAVVYLAGGTKGGSSTADFTAAIDALEACRGNFVIPLVSRNASLDYADALTESSSTYDVDSINAYTKTHVLKMSTLKRRRNRQAFLSKTDTFTNAKQAAADIATFRATMAFQDFKATGSDGSITQFQSWMGAVLAAGMQAGAFYKAIFNKGINCSGVLMRDASFSDKNDTQLEDALDAGLMPAKKSLTGGYSWVSDQTTYGKDSNFVFNSCQAVYVADTIGLTIAQRMEAAFVGQSVADINAGLALSYLGSIMADFMRLKLIAPSDDAKLGYKNATVQINGGSMLVNVEVKLAGALYFIEIPVLVSPVIQRAG